MTLSYTNLKPIKVTDPRVNISEAKNYLFKQGANVVTHRTFTATSANDSNVTFKCNPPNSDIVVSRLVYLNFQVEFRLHGTVALRGNQAAVAGSRPLLAANTLVATDLTKLVAGDGDGLAGICLRQFPIASVMRTLKVNLNSDTITVQPYRYIHALSRFNLSDDDKANGMSSSPAQQDEFQKYSDRANEQVQRGAPGAIVASNRGLNYGQARSPFASMGAVPYEIPRASYKPVSADYITNAANLDDVATNYTKIVYDITEPLFISPFSPGCYDMMGFSQLTTLDIDISFDSSKISRMLSIDETTISNVLADTAPREGLVGAGAGVGELNSVANSRRLDVNNGIDVKFENSLSKISFIYLTPQVNKPRPEALVYPYHDLYVYNKIQTELAAGDSAKYNSDNMSLSNIPDKVYIFGMLRDQDKSAYTADCFARIKDIDINFNGVSGILSSANEWELWKMSSSNGLKMSYNQWKQYSGSVLCINFGKDIGTGPQQCVGLLGTFDFSYRITLENIDTEDKIFELFTVIDSAGTLTISNTQIVKQLGIMSTNDVLQAEEYKEMDAQYLEKMYGGNFMEGLRNVFTKAQKLKPYGKKAIKIGKELTPLLGAVAPRASNIARAGLDFADELLGQGYSQADIKKLKKMGYTNKDLEELAYGGNVVGGAGYSKNKLATRMSTYR